MTIETSARGAPLPGRGNAEPAGPEIEQELTEILLEETPEGRGPSRKIVHRELVVIGAVAVLAMAVCVGLILAMRPSYSMILTIAVLGIIYACASPVLIALPFRRRDEAVAHERAHRIVEGDPAHGGVSTQVNG